MTLTDAWFVKMAELSMLVHRFEQGDPQCDFDPYIEIKFNDGAFDNGDITYSSGEVTGIRDFESLSEAVAIVRKLLERQATAGVLGPTFDFMDGAA